MVKKKQKYDISKQYDFDIERGYVEKENYIEAKRNPTAIIYVRVSDKKQVEEWNGLESQEATCRRWAESKGVKIIKVFSDAGKSGADMQREGITNAIEYLKTENAKNIKIRYFLCSEVSRISRSENIGETSELKTRIELTGAKIITTASGRNISSKDINDEFMTDISIAIAKSERLKIRERSLNWSKAKLLSGYWIFDVPVGYKRIYIKNGTKTEKLLQRLEPQASIVKEWLEMFANGVLTNNSQLLEYFNKKQLKSNSHSAKPWKLTLTFIKRLLEIEKLYFYAGYILYPNPNYGITQPVEAVHESLITLSTVHKIYKRMSYRGKSKSGIRKDTSEEYPLRWSVYCPCCNYAMTGWKSTGKMWVKYKYYWCNRKDCKGKENINADKMHEDFKELLNKLTPKEWVLKLLDAILKEVFSKKNKIQSSINKANELRIRKIEQEIEKISDTIWKLSKVELIQSMEEKRTQLEEEKEALKNQLQDKVLNDKEFILLYEKVKNIIKDPISIRELWPVELKKLLLWVLFGSKIYYKKNEKFQTPHLSSLYLMFEHLNDAKVSSGAGDETRTRNQLLGRQWL